MIHRTVAALCLLVAVLYLAAAALVWWDSETHSIAPGVPAPTSMIPLGFQVQMKLGYPWALLGALLAGGIALLCRSRSWLPIAVLGGTAGAAAGPHVLTALVGGTAMAVIYATELLFRFLVPPATGIFGILALGAVVAGVVRRSRRSSGI